MNEAEIALLARCGATLKDCASTIKSLIADVERLEKQNWDLTLALLNRPVPADCPGPTFPEPVAPHVDPPPEHPDHHEVPLIIAAMSLDQRLAS